MGKPFFFDLNLAPNFFKGVVTLEKSLNDKLLSPLSFSSSSKLINNPRINLPRVPEFPAFKVNFL